MRIVMKILLGVLVLAFLVVIGSFLLIRMINPENYYERAENWIQEQYDVTVQFEGESQLSWAGFSPKLQVETVIYGDPAQITGHNLHISFDEILQIWRDIRQGQPFQVDITAESIDLDTIHFENVTLPLLIGDQIETVEPFSARLFNGDLSGRFVIDGNRLSFTGDLENIDVSQFVSNFVFDVNGAADLTGQIGAGFRESLQGEAILRSHGGHLTGNMIDRWAGDVLLNLLPGEREDTQLECMTAPFKIQNGIAHTDAVIISTNTVIIMGSGHINLPEAQIDFEFTPTPLDPGLLNFATPITVTGDITDPSVAPTHLGVLRTLGGLIAGVVNPLTFLLSFSTLGASPLDEDCIRSARTILEQ